MSVEVTPWAVEILERSVAAAQRLNPDAQIRLALNGGQLQPGLVDGPTADDIVLAVGSVTICVDPAISGVIDVESPHDRLVVRPAGSAPNERE